jgi:hypothetical protein
MQYALLIYVTEERRAESQSGEMPAAIARILERPEVSAWLRLRDTELATTVRGGTGRTLMTDGPFVESKEFLGGLVVVDADDLDGALAIAEALQDLGRTAGIEVRPVLE